MRKIYATITSKSSSGATKSIKEVIDLLEDYKRNLNDKVGEFVNRLLDVGIETAQANTGDYGQYIQFEKKIEGTNDVIGVLIATDTKVLSQWQTSKGVVGYEVSPLLLAEFGSGWLSKVKYDIQGVGQGTMPNSKGHATDLKGWFWKDLDGKKHHSYGEKPTYPMYSAISAMLFEIDRIANEVFNG